MAKVLEDYDWGSHRGNRGHYDRLVDGNTWELEPGKDGMPASVQSIRSSLQAAAKRVDKRVRTRHVDGKLIVQAYDPPSS
jgi:hypothetical protein